MAVGLAMPALRLDLMCPHLNVRLNESEFIINLTPFKKLGPVFAMLLSSRLPRELYPT